MTHLLLCLYLSPGPVPDPQPFAQFPDAARSWANAGAYNVVAVALYGRANDLAVDDPAGCFAVRAVADAVSRSARVWCLVAQCQSEPDPWRAVIEAELRRLVGDVAFDFGWLPPPIGIRP